MNEIELNNGIRMPQLGFGVFQITDQQICKESVKAALETDYRMIDTAASYWNEAAVGETIRESDINRKEIFLVSKVWIQDAGYEKTMASFEKTLLIWGRTIWIYILFICPTGTITEAGRPWRNS